MNDTVRENARILRARALSATARDWVYARKHSVKNVKWADRESPSILSRLVDGTRDAAIYLRLHPEKSDSLLSLLYPDGVTLRGRVDGIAGSVYANLKRNVSRPDGIVAGGRVLAFWEEDGEFIQCMSPEVALLVADFLDAEPDNEHAQKIAAELAAIQGAYEARERAVSPTEGAFRLKGWRLRPVRDTRDMRESLKRGLDQAARGDVHDLGSFR